MDGRGKRPEMRGTKEGCQFKEHVEAIKESPRYRFACPSRNAMNEDLALAGVKSSKKAHIDVQVPRVETHSTYLGSEISMKHRSTLPRMPTQAFERWKKVTIIIPRFLCRFARLSSDVGK